MFDDRWNPLLRQPETGNFRTVIKQIGFDSDSVTCVLDLGSRDCIEACDMADLFPNARVVAVEANPPAIDLCHQTVRQRGKTGRVEIVGAAINSYDGRCTFHAIDAARTITPWSDGNIGASSLFKANGQYPHETYFQSPVEVPCVRLDSLLRTLNAETPQVIWLDLQGGEMLALQSLGERLCDVRLVHTEVSMKPAYDGQVLWPELRNFLVSGGFQIAPGGGPNLGEWQSDAIFYRPPLLP